MSAKFTQPRAAVYCRLSKDDDLKKGESVSIQTQRDMLVNYCEEQGFEVVAVYQDDGYSGINTNRPDFQRMLKAIERGQIDVVVTKDLSRLGRNYLDTGELIVKFFTRNNVRYIAVNDSVDTLEEVNDITPFKNMLNEMYSKDISKKVHSSYVTKARKGDYTGCLVPLGYMKSPLGKNKLVIDEKTAWIIRKIYDEAMKGYGTGAIRRHLYEDKVEALTWWNRKRGLRDRVTRFEKEDPVNGKYIWDESTIRDILQNPVYIGSVCSQKFNYKFKLGVIGEKRKEDWIIVENMHEPIIDKAVFEIVQEKNKKAKKKRRMGELLNFFLV